MGKVEGTNEITRYLALYPEDAEGLPCRFIGIYIKNYDPEQHGRPDCILVEEKDYNKHCNIIIPIKA